MNKKLIALAVAGVFAPAVALAQGTNVTIYGTLNADLEWVKADGASFVPSPNNAVTNPLGTTNGVNTDSRSRVSSNSSNIGFRVREDLGGGMTAWGQCESSANVDAGGGTLCSRNTGLGVESGFGNLFLGQWDTPYKVSTGGLDPMGNVGIAQYVGIMGSPGLNTASGTVANGQASGTTSSLSIYGFDRRQQNSVQYWTPNWSGFSARVVYGANEEKTVVTNATVAQATFNPMLWGASVTYDNGPLYITGAYEKHDDYTTTAAGSIPVALGVAAAQLGTVTGSNDDAWKVGLGYKFGNFQLVGMYEWLAYKQDTTSGTWEQKRDGWMVGGKYTGGAWNLGLSYMQGDDLKCSTPIIPTTGTCGDTGAYMWAARAGYNLSKRTEVYALYTQISNDNHAQYNFGTNPVPGTAVNTPTSGVAMGADPTGFALGLRHTF